jgi:uncharacterized lipoprotein YddW (UPF0748 family)
VKPPKENITHITSEELRGALAEALKGQIERETTGTLKAAEEQEAVSPERSQEKASALPSQTPAGEGIAQAAAPEGEELRGIWVTRFEWASRNAATLKEKISGMLDEIKEANFNVVLLQVRGEGDVLYRSPIEPWSPLVGSEDPGFDPLAFAIEEAHKRGLQLHAVMNLYPVWQGEEPPPSTTPVHPFLLHCQPLSLVNWLCADASGQAMECSPQYDKYYWLSPGIPEVQAYLRKVVADVVKRYNIDGIELDRARYPGKEFSRDKISVARFEGVGNPQRLGWEDWQREQVNRLIHDIYAEIRMEKPNVCFSAAVWGIYDRFAIPGYAGFSDGRNDYYQDSLAWMRNGSMDALMPMIYWDIQGKGPHFDELLKDFVVRAQGGKIFPLISPTSAKQDWLQEIALTRELGTKGVAIFSYSGLTQRELWEKLGDGAFAKPARVPQLARKAGANTAIITGYVYDATTRKGLEDCVVEIRGTRHQTYTSGDGFFALLDVEPGEGMSVLARRADKGSAIVSDVSVAPNETKRITLTISK